MKKNTHQRFYSHLTRLRKIVQIFSLLFLIAVPVLNLMGIRWIIGTLYALSIDELDMVDPVMALQTLLLTKSVYMPLLIATIIPLVTSLTFGRVFCSWICPKNTISDWLEVLQKPIIKQRWQTVRFSLIEKNPHPGILWGILAVLLLIVWISGFPLLGYLSMPGIISSQISQTILGMGHGLEFGLVLIIFVVEIVLVQRYWCKYFCPVGACLSIFRIKRTLRIQHKAMLCTCKQEIEPCHAVCPLGLSPKCNHHLYPYCFHCGLCLTACEKTGRRALSYTFRT